MPTLLCPYGCIPEKFYRGLGAINLHRHYDHPDEPKVTNDNGLMIVVENRKELEHEMVKTGRTLTVRKNAHWQHRGTKYPETKCVNCDYVKTGFDKKNEICPAKKETAQKIIDNELSKRIEV